MKKQLLISAMLIGGAVAALAAEPAHLTSSPYQGAEIQAGGTYYLYNVETGTWVDLNDQIPYAWSCTGTLNKDGFDIRLDKPDGFVGYKIFTNTVNNSSLRADDSGPEYQFGCDAGSDPTDWLIEPKAGSVSNAYTIRVEALDGAISEAFNLGAGWMDELNCYTLVRDLDGTGLSTWQFVTREERLKKMVEDAKANPEGVDATWLIPNHNMVTGNLRDDQCWKGTSFPSFVSHDNINNITGGDNRGLVSREAWQGTTFKYTVIEGLPEGSYSYSVSGFYREGNPWASQKTEGPFNNKAWYFAGAQSALFMNLFDDAQPVEDKAHGYADEVNGKYFPGYGAGVTFKNGHYKNTPLTTNVSADGKLLVGIYKNEVIAEDSFNFKQMHLTYKASKAAEDVTAIKARLSALIAEVEPFNDPKIADALAAGKAALNGSGSEMMEALIQLTPVIAPVSAYNRIKAMIPAGTDISKAQALYDAATNNDEINNATNTLRIIRRLAMMPRVNDMYTGASAIPESGIFYLYNVGQKQFMDGGGEWAAHAIFDSPGAEFTAENIDGLKCKLGTNFANGANHYFASWGSFDGDNSPMWEFVPVEGQENVFRLCNSDDANRNHVLYIPFSRPQNSDCERALSTSTKEADIDPADPNAWWKIVTREERDAMLQNASLTNPIDASHHIFDPGFNRIIYAQQAGIWSQSGANFASQWGNYISETLEISGITPDEFELFQEIPAGELPYGVYVIECNGYYRDGNLETKGDQIGQVDRDPVKPVNFFTNDPESSVPLCNILEGNGMAPGEGVKVTSKAGKTYEVPGNFDDGVKYFRSGAYKNRIVTNFQNDPDNIEDAGMWIGLEVPAENADQLGEGNYINVDNFRITYYGNNTTVEAVKEAISSGINDIISEEPAAAATDNRIFNLQGIQVANPTAPGIYICNGKKFVVR